MESASKILVKMREIKDLDKKHIEKLEEKAKELEKILE